MDWMRLEANYARNPKVVAAGPRLAMAHLRAMGWSTEHETGGHIPREMLSVIPLTRHEAKQLTDRHLFDLNGDGWYIHDWDVYQLTAEEMAEERERREERKAQARKRQADKRKRDKQRDVTRDITRDKQRDNDRD